MALASARCVVIAGAGDVGQRLARRLAGRGDEVIALRRRQVAPEPGIRMLRADLASGEGLARLPRRPQALVYCAAPDQREEAAYRRLFVDGLRRVLDAVDVARLVFVSSTAVYAQDQGEWVDEESIAASTAFNGRVLLEAEAELRAHPAATALRLSGLYGPGRDRMLRRARSGEPGQRRWSNRLHVDDAAAALLHLLDLQAPERVYLGSDDQPALECEVLAWIREREGLPAIATTTSDESGRRVANGRLRRSGWMPGHPDYRSGYLPMLAGPGV